MKKLLAMLLALIMVLSMVACGAKETPDAPAADADKPAADKPADAPADKPADAPAEDAEPRTLTIGWEVDPGSLNAHAQSANVVLQVGHIVHGMLTSLNDENGGAIQPAIAASWEYISSTELILHLREDVYWHNGRQLVADDIVFTFDWVLDEANASVRRNNFAGKVESVTADDEFTVRMKLSTPDPALLELLAYLPLVAEDTVDTLDTAPIGCGPFKFVSWDQGQQINFETFDQWYNAGSIQFDYLVMRTFQDYNAAMAAFLAGEVDILNGVKTTDIAAIEARGDQFHVESIADTGNYVSCNTMGAPLDNPKVREAVKYAIDKEELIYLLLAGVGEAVSQPYPTTSEYYNPDLDWEYDLERAKQALIDAGYPNGCELTILVPNTQARVDLATVLKEQLEKAGFIVTVDVQESATMFEMWKTAYGQLAIGGFGYYADPSFRSTFINSEQNNNWTRYGFDNAEYNELARNGMASTDKAERQDIYTRMWELGIDEAGFFMLYSSTSNAGVKNNIEGLVYRGQGNSDFTKITFND